MTKPSYTTDLLKAAKLAAIKENDQLLQYLIDMAIERASIINTKDTRQSA